MPLTIQGFNEMGGLVTSSNDLNRPANSLRDCSNVVYTEIGTTQARKGHPYMWAPPSSSTAYNQQWMALFQHPDLVESKYGFYVPASGYGNVFKVDVDFSGAITLALVKQYTTSTTTTANTEAAATGEYLPSTATSYWSVPRSVVAQKNVYFMAANGLFRSVQGASNNLFKKVVPCSFSALTLTADTTDPKINWLLPGYKVAVRAIVKEQIGETAYLEWGDSGVIEYVNYDVPINLIAAITLYTTGQKDLGDLTVEIYRTMQYKPNEPPPTEFYLAETFTASTADSNTNTKLVFSNRYLRLGDDAVRGSGIKLYFGNDSELRNTVPPVAKDITNFKGYTIYGNVAVPAVADVALTSVPAFEDILAIKDLTTDIPIKFANVANETNVPSANGFLTTWATSQLGTDSYKGRASISTTDYPLVIRPLLETITTAIVCGVTPHLSTALKLDLDSSTNPQIIKVTLDKKYTNLTLFESPGICAVTNSSGAVKDIFTYTDFEVIRNIVEFTGAQSLINFASGTGSPYNLNGVRYLYFIPGTNISSLPVFAIHPTTAVTGTDVPTQLGFSLLPTKINHLYGDYWTDPVGVCIKPLALAAGNTLQTQIDFFGVRSRDSAAQLLLSAQNWVVTYNAARNALSPIASWLVIDNQIKIRFENIRVGESVGVKHNYISLRKDTGDTFQTEPNIAAAASTYTEMLFEDVQVKNGVSISKLNRPDAVALRQVLSPLKIGRDDREIDRLIATEDSVYVFKSQEGIYRLDLAEGFENPQGVSVILIDNTTWLVGTESVQEINEAIYFLSNKGVIRLSGNSMTVLSDAIDVEIRRATTTAVKANTTGTIRSFGNEVRKLYGVYIPGVATFVYDISAGMWAKWDITFDNALVNADGRLLTTEALSNWNYIRQDVYLTSLDDAVDQYDGLWNLSGATIATLSGSSCDITQAASTNLFDSMFKIAEYIGTRSVYLLAGSTYYKGTIAKTMTPDKVRFTFDASETPIQITTSHSLVLGINTSITVNKYWVGAASRGAQFNKFNLFVNGVVDDVRVGFEMDNSNPDFSTSTFSTFDTESDILTTLVPRCQGNGRWVMFRAEHSYPKQHFQAQGFSYVIRPMRTDRVERD